MSDTGVITYFSPFFIVARYDPKTDTWSEVAPMSVGRDGVGLCVLGDKLMAVGGYDGTQYLDLVEAFDPISNTWAQVRAIWHLYLNSIV